MREPLSEPTVEVLLYKSPSEPCHAIVVTVGFLGCLVCLFMFYMTIIWHGTDPMSVSISCLLKKHDYSNFGTFFGIIPLWYWYYISASEFFWFNLCVGNVSYYSFGLMPSYNNTLFSTQLF